MKLATISYSGMYEFCSLPLEHTRNRGLINHEPLYLIEDDVDLHLKQKKSVDKGGYSYLIPSLKNLLSSLSNAYLLKLSI